MDRGSFKDQVSVAFPNGAGYLQNLARFFYLLSASGSEMLTHLKYVQFHQIESLLSLCRLPASTFSNKPLCDIHYANEQSNRVLIKIWGSLVLLAAAWTSWLEWSWPHTGLCVLGKSGRPWSWNVNQTNKLKILCLRWMFSKLIVRTCLLFFFWLFLKCLTSNRCLVTVNDY